MTITNITPLPTPVPSRADPANFAVRGDAFLGALPVFGDELNAFASSANALATDVENNKNTSDEILADTQALKSEMNIIYSSSVATSNFKGLWSELTGTLDKPASVFYSGAYWVLLNDLADVTTSVPTDFSSDWLRVPNSALGITYDSVANNSGATEIQTAIDKLFELSKVVASPNLVINPEFKVYQAQGTTTIPLNTPAYIYDQWLFYSTGTQAPSMTDAGGRIFLQGAFSGNTSTVISQRIESKFTYWHFDKTGIQAQLQLSMSIGTSSARTVTWYLRTPSSYDVFPASTVIATGSFSVTGTDTVYYTNVDVSTEKFMGGLQLDIVIPALNGLNEKIDIGEVQIVRTSNSVKVPFIPRTYQQELMLCQRYYQFFRVVVPTLGASYTLPLPVEMRATPTVTGGGTGFAVAIASNKAPTVYQTTRAEQNLIFNARL